FWTRETGADGRSWVEASAGDDAAIARWQKKHAAEKFAAILYCGIGYYETTFCNGATHVFRSARSYDPRLSRRGVQSARSLAARPLYERRSRLHLVRRPHAARSPGLERCHGRLLRRLPRCRLH